MENVLRLTNIRFPLIILIIYIHSFVTSINLGENIIVVEPAAWVVASTTFISDGVARVAVPMFYLTSGYLYFSSFDGSLTQYRQKSSRRVHSLFIPYVFWNGLVFTLFFVGQIVPQTASFFNSSNGRLIDQPLWQLVNIWLGITRYPIAYPFWFIRDLMLIAALTPLIYWVLRRSPGVLETALLFAWLCMAPEPPIATIEGLTFFIIGASFAMHRRSIFMSDGHLVWLLPLFLVTMLINTYLRLEHGIEWLHRPAILIGVAVFLGCTAPALKCPQLKRNLTTLSTMSFFIFAAHEPLMTVLRKLAYSLVGVNQLTISLIYLITPLVVVMLTLGCFLAMKRIAPAVLSVLNGGRV